MFSPKAVRATFGPAKEFRPGSRRGSVSDGWLPIQCCSEGKGRVVKILCLCGLWVDRTCMVTMLHPCRVKSFRKALSAVMDNLGKVLAKKIMAKNIIDITVVLK